MRPCGRATRTRCCSAPGRASTTARITGPAVSHWRTVAGAIERRLGAAHEDAQFAVARLASAALAAGMGSDAVALYHRVWRPRPGTWAPITRARPRPGRSTRRRCSPSAARPTRFP